MLVMGAFGLENVHVAEFFRINDFHLEFEDKLSFFAFSESFKNQLQGYFLRRWHLG